MQQLRLDKTGYKSGHNVYMVDKIGHFRNLVDTTGHTRMYCVQNRAYCLKHSRPPVVHVCKKKKDEGGVSKGPNARRRAKKIFAC